MKALNEYKASSHIVFGGIWRYSTVLQYPRASIWKHSDQILNTGKYPQYREITSATLATVGNHMGTHQIPLDTFGNPEYSNYLLFKRYWISQSEYPSMWVFVAGAPFPPSLPIPSFLPFLPSVLLSTLCAAGLARHRDRYSTAHLQALFLSPVTI